MKIIRQLLKKNKNIETNNTTTEEKDIVLFNNSPIGKSNNDIFDLSIKAQAVKKAIDEKANTVALIGEYGSGKSSLTNILYEDNKECFEKPIYINLWIVFVNMKLKLQIVKIKSIYSQNLFYINLRQDMVINHSRNI